ncbi:hypothetical protein N7517_002783 [Penicillium concentricum]|uniref:Uncharacterized protein n=1 Tax=Penicillium concentricum TaxID=293559 RepID=A0A9W9SUG8_9EURO|nr:uncharacterized protein N7517_002783 [Penicillium concentricum]KAJ5384872.1 hypothetical protein N7517_002783 [Penicillium concentricum]
MTGVYRVSTSERLTSGHEFSVDKATKRRVGSSQPQKEFWIIYGQSRAARLEQRLCMGNAWRRIMIPLIPSHNRWVGT